MSRAGSVLMLLTGEPRGGVINFVKSSNGILWPGDSVPGVYTK